MTLTSHLLGDPSLPPLLFLHGLLGSTEDFLPMIASLQKAFYCIGVDLPGHGSSPLIKPLTSAYLLTLLKEIMQKHRCSYIVGYSLGGRLAMQLDLLYPHLLSKIAILSAHPGLNTSKKKEKKKSESSWLKILDTTPELFLKKWYSQPLFRTLSLDLIYKKRKDLNYKNIAAVMKALSLSKQISLWEHLTTTKKNYLFLCGEDDEIYYSLYQRISHLSFSIPNASHAIHLENPLLCAKHLKTFFSSDFQ